MKKYVLVLSIFCVLVTACQRTTSTPAAQPSQMPAATPTQPPPTLTPAPTQPPPTLAPTPTQPPPTLVPPPAQPPAGDPYADRVVHFSLGNPANADLDDPQTTLGPPDFDETTLTGFLTLGVGGSVTVEFVDNVAVDGPGPDIEIAGDPDDDDQWIAEVSADGVNYKSFGRVRERVRLDLATVGLASARFVRLTDDGDPAGGISPGAELDAVLALNSAAPEGSPPPRPDLGAEVRIGVVYPLLCLSARHLAGQAGVASIPAAGYD